ncbi:stage II sporulation protein M [Halovivax limisalsi]|uniref:stage II sporulation protein M n=1 Tax=Halovivax limisalsi TaxID=1453760 RepID=UPI001FFD92C2|nr:stage II sporulation protein M [Halovivax limisalsi]
MRLGVALTTVRRTVRSRPLDLLGFYILGMATAAFPQLLLLVALALAGGYLYVTGRLATIGDELAGLDAPPDPQAAPAAFERWADEAALALEPAVTGPTVAIAAVTALLIAVSALVVWSAMSAGQLGACFGRLRSESGLRAGIDAALTYWLSFLGLLVLELLTWIALLIALGLVIGVSGALTAIGSIGALLGLLGVVFAVVGAIVGAIAIRLTFAFAPVAVVVDDVPAVRSVYHAGGFVRYRKREAGFYAVIAVAGAIAVGLLTSLLGVVGVVAGTGLLGTLVLLPTLDLLKTTLYGGGRGRIDPPEPDGRSRRRQLRDGLGRGVSELVAFVREAPGTHAVAAAALVGGIALGWVGAGPLDGVVESSIDARLAGHVAPAAAVEFFGNNWSVALTMAASGLFLAIPAVTLLAFNGAMIGALARTEVEPLELLAFIAPHGVFELPAIVIAGAAGIFLGRHAWAAWRGRGTRETLANALERVLWVLVGVGILLLVAGLIEGFVSPYYWRPFL